MSIFLHRDVLLGDLHMLVDGREHPREVLVQNSMRRLNPQLFQDGYRFGTADDSNNVGHATETLPVDVPFDFGEQVPDTDASHKDDDVDLAGNQAVSKVDGLTVLCVMELRQRGADVGDPAEALDQRAMSAWRRISNAATCSPAKPFSGIWCDSCMASSVTSSLPGKNPVDGQGCWTRRRAVPDWINCLRLT